MIQTACEITFVGMDAVEAARAEVRAWLPRLGALMETVSAGHVFIESVEEHRKERLFRVRMELTTPHGLLTITHTEGVNAAHEDLYVAIRNAFRAARRALESGANARATAPPAQPPSTDQAAG